MKREGRARIGIRTFSNHVLELSLQLCIFVVDTPHYGLLKGTVGRSAGARFEIENLDGGARAVAGSCAVCWRHVHYLSWCIWYCQNDMDLVRGKGDVSKEP